jgi:hypothetical protein
MFKVSFKNTPEQPAKVVLRRTVNGKEVTTVTLTGSFRIPSQISRLPQPVIDWMFQDNLIYKVSADNTFFIGATGKATKHPNDEDNPVLAERIAEAKAKIKIYKYMRSLINRIASFYADILLGTSGIIEDYDNKEDSLYASYDKYQTLYTREVYHLSNLLYEL